MIVFFYTLIALCAALIILNAYRKGNESGKRIGRVMIAAFLLIIFYTLSLTGDNYREKSFFLSISFITTDYMVIFFYEYVLHLINRNDRVVRSFRRAFFSYAIVDCIFFLINPYKEIMVSYSKKSFSGITVFKYQPGLMFLAHMSFIFIIVVLSILLLFEKCRKTPKVYRRRYYMLIAGTIAAIFGNVFYFLQIDYMPVDLSGVFYCILGMLMYFNTFKYLPTVTMGLAKTMILDHLNEPVLLFDYEGRVADYSKAVKDLFPDVDFQRSEINLEEFLSDNRFSGMGNPDSDQEFEWSKSVNNMVSTFLCKYRRVKDEKGRLLGTMLVFADISFARDAYFELERSIMYDPLSGFYNKDSFMKQIPQWNDKRYWPVALAVCNINGLRQVNETKGTPYGDAIMREFAAVIRREIGSDVFAAKIDNGDYVVVFEESSHQEAAEIFERIKRGAEELLSKEQLIRIEYGIAVKDRDDVTIDRVLSDARASMQNKKMVQEGSASSSIVDSLKQTLGESDFETEEHVERTQKMAARLGRELKLSDSDIGKLELLAVLHDIGKVAIPHHVLVKKGKLNDEEFKIMQQHTVKGYRIAMASPELRDIAEGILSHHEKWDGTGYPNHLKGEDIPLLARIISAVDSHDVMVNDRPYHQAMPEQEAIKELRRCAGTQFDPHVIEVFTEMLESDLKNNGLSEGE